MGNILAAQTERGVCAILIGDDADQLVRDLQDRFPKATLVSDAPEYLDLVVKVVGLDENPNSGFGLPLDIQGTAFQKRVWNALQQIPPGTTATYTEIAANIGMPKAVRAVAQACGANSLAIAIPCHRVIRNDGALSGYRWGVERKRTFTGGEFVLTEQRPRMQSRPEVVSLQQGDAAAFAMHQRPHQGSRGFYRVNLRHGVSRVRSGRRHVTGIIFHDAS